MTTVMHETYTPGDSTRYDMLLMELPRGTYNYDGSVPAYLLCVQNMGICFTFAEHQYIDVGVLEYELPAVNAWTLRAMAEWIHLKSGVPVGGPPIVTVQEMRAGTGTDEEKES